MLEDLNLIVPFLPILGSAVQANFADISSLGDELIE